MEAKIGVRFGDTDKQGVILQTCKTLPKHHNRSDEQGPFFGVMYDHKPYKWYNYEQINKVLNG